MNELKPTESQSHLITLSPEFQEEIRLIVVSGRLRRVEDMEPRMVRPVIRDPKHPLFSLIIKDCDEKLFHPGPERVFSKLRHNYWILRNCKETSVVLFGMYSRKWKAKPSI